MKKGRRPGSNRYFEFCQDSAAAYKTKKSPQPPLRRLWALALSALASPDIQYHFRFTVPTVDRKALGLCVFIDPQKPMISIANRACNPSILYVHFTTYFLKMQVFFSQNYRPPYSRSFSHLLQLIPRSTFSHSCGAAGLWQRSQN